MVAKTSLFTRGKLALCAACALVPAGLGFVFRQWHAGSGVNEQFLYEAEILLERREFGITSDYAAFLAGLPVVSETWIAGGLVAWMLGLAALVFLVGQRPSIDWPR